MSFRLQPEAPLSAAILHVLREEIRRGHRALTRGPSWKERVHETRTTCKKIRALLRLLREAAPKFARREDDRFRDLAHIMSPLRDADALSAACEALLESRRRAAGPHRFGPLRRRLRDNRRRRVPALELKLAAAQLREARRRFARATLPRVRFADLARQFAKNYRAARHAMRAAYAGASDESFHRWRRRTKAFGYHCRLLRQAWPRPMKALQRETDRLGELLGGEHDLAMLVRFLRARDIPDLPPGRVPAFLRLIQSRRARLQAQARPLGGKIFADPPRRVRRRLLAWWRAAAATRKPRNWPARSAL